MDFLHGFHQFCLFVGSCVFALLVFVLWRIKRERENVRGRASLFPSTLDRVDVRSRQDEV